MTKKEKVEERKAKLNRLYGSLPKLSGKTMISIQYIIQHEIALYKLMK